MGPAPPTNALTCTSSQDLIAQFLLESAQARTSDAHGYDFSLESCLSRLATSQALTIWVACARTVSSANLEFTRSRLTLRWSGGKTKRIHWHEVLGVIVGPVSSQQLFFQQEVTDSFSVVLAFERLTFSTSSALLRYDLLIALCWLSQVNRPVLTMLPLNKRKLYSGTLLVFTVRQKVRAEARERRVSVSELFLVRFT